MFKPPLLVRLRFYLSRLKHRRGTYCDKCAHIVSVDYRRRKAETSRLKPGATHPLTD